MKYLRYIFGALGIVLIIVLFIFVKEYFPDPAVWALDLVVACIAAAAAVYSFSAVMGSNEEVAANVAGMGVHIWVTGVYIVLAIAVGLIGFSVPVDFKWQLLIQLALLVMLASGIFGGHMANQRLNGVEVRSQLNHAARESLVFKSQQLKVAVIALTDEDLRSRINKLCDRIGFITPSHSPMAVNIENQISLCLDTIEQLVNAREPAENVIQQLNRAELLLKQRIQTY